MTGDHDLDGWSQERNKKPRIVNKFSISIENAKRQSAFFFSSFPFPLSFEFNFLRLAPLDSGGCIIIALWRTSRSSPCQRNVEKIAVQRGGKERIEGDGGVLTN